jgi:hypothetical protein
MFPRKLIPQHREHVNYDLCAANGTTIRTYEWLPLSLNLGLRREFTWRFVVADVTQPLIGADFLSHFASWWTVRTTAFWTQSRRCMPLPKLPVRRPPA